MYRPFACRQQWTFQNFNPAAVMDVLGDLGEIAHIESLRADRAFIEVIALTLSDAVAIGAGVAGKFYIHHRSSRMAGLNAREATGSTMDLDAPPGAGCMGGGVPPCGLSGGAPPPSVSSGPVQPCGWSWPLLSGSTVRPVL